MDHNTENNFSTGDVTGFAMQGTNSSTYNFDAANDAVNNAGTGAMKGKDNMPLGLGMALGMNSYANGYWNSLDTSQKAKVTQYIQNCATGNEAKEKIDKAIYALEHHNLDLLK